MILNDAVKRVKRVTHRGSQAVTNDQITIDIVQAINDSRRDTIRLVPKDWLRKSAGTPITTVSGTSTYSLASDVQEPLLFRYTVGTTDYFLNKIDSEREFYQQTFGSNTANDKPRFFVDLGLDGSGNRQILLFPTPDAAYVINYVYYKDPSKTELTVADLNTEIPDVPSYLQDVLWKGARYYFLMGFDDAAQSIAKADFEQAKLDVEKADNMDLDSEMALRFGFQDIDRRSPSGIRIVP